MSESPPKRSRPPQSSPPGTTPLSRPATTARASSDASQPPANSKLQPQPPELRRPLPVASEVQHNLEILIRARYPLLQILSWEEERVLNTLDTIAQQLSKHIFQWTVNSGLVRYRSALSGPADEGPRGTRDPIIALREIAQSANNEPSIFVLKDFHPYMEESSVVRGLRDLAILLRSTYSTVVLLSPQLAVPPELEKDLTVVDFPLPGRQDLLAFFDTLNADLANHSKLHFDNSPETRQRLMDAAIGLTMNEVENVFAQLLVRRGRLSAAEVPEVYHEKRQIIRKSGILEYIDPEESIDSVGGLAELKDWLRKRRRAFLPKARQFGLPMPKGVMFLGVQGCGKSLAAKAVSRFWQMPLLRLDMGQLFGSLVGASEENVRRAIRIAESVAPAILWIDEIDKGFSGLASSGYSDGGTTSRVFATLITWLQEKHSPVFVIATANNVEVLPPELMRQGRFDEVFFVDLPTQEERMEIFRIHLARRKRTPDRFDLATLASEAEGFSGAEIEQALISALYDAFDHKHDLGQDDILAALRATQPLSVLMSEEIERRRSWARARTRPAS